MKKRIKEVIVVEGIHDEAQILKCVSADVLVSNGKSFDSDFLRLCKQFNETQGIIVFTDPDGPGEYIRQKIIATVGTCKHASLHVLQSKNKKRDKVGLEHASCQDIIEALDTVSTYDVEAKTLSYEEFLDLRLNGYPESQRLRNQLSEAFHFPVSNAKRCFKYLNMLSKTKKMCQAVLEGNAL